MSELKKQRQGEMCDRRGNIGEQEKIIKKIIENRLKNERKMRSGGGDGVCVCVKWKLL